MRLCPPPPPSHAARTSSWQDSIPWDDVLDPHKLAFLKYSISESDMRRFEGGRMGPEEEEAFVAKLQASVFRTQSEM
jgi:hypothetical protein